MTIADFRGRNARGRRMFFFVAQLVFLILLGAGVAARVGLEHAPNTWVKRSPTAETLPSPRLGYEGACVWDTRHHVLLRYGGHNQGGGGEQGSELWTFDPLTGKWTLKEPNTSPPGVCCAQQNVFDPVRGRYVRFPSFSGNHGWQWRREIHLNTSSVWVYDLETNLWRNLRPLPAPQVSPLRCASWDSDEQVIVLFGGEGNREGTVVYDPHTNTWARMNPPVEPAFRSGGNMVYDAARKLHILFGSQFTDDPHTWGYDLRKNEWRDLKPETLPPTDRNDAVLAYDSLNQVVVASVKITEGKEEEARHRLETWAFDAGENTWRKMNPPKEPDPSGNRARVLSFAPELGLTVLENCTHPPQGPREQQIWTYRLPPSKAAPAASPSPPTEFRVTTSADSATLVWTASSSPNVSGYAIYRGTGERPWEVKYEKLAEVDAGNTTYRDTDLKSGTIYFYAIRSVAGSRMGGESVKARTQPPFLEDVVVSVLSPETIEITWKPAEARDVVGYHLERATVEVLSDDQLVRLKNRLAPLPVPSVGAVRRIGKFERVNDRLLKTTTFVNMMDLTTPQSLRGEPLAEYRFSAEQIAPKGKAYPFAVFAYRILAVNALGVESGPSPYFLTIPSSPQSVFSKEDGTTCRLKWAENPEKKLRGYRVYRLDGRWDSDSISRRTAEPIEVPGFVDEGAGKETRRYHVVAVDTLGQEGLPSAPVWFEREWKQFYTPFVGEWHQ